MNTPKVFVSHASEDKHRFVIDFATKLRQNGIDAWVDQWEIKVGDSLVKKIFEEGLGTAQAVIVILSKNSVDKPWVREELDHAVVSKISEGIRIIPLILDECEVPQSLKATKWVSFKNPSLYNASFSEIVATIFGATDKPPLGNPPFYAAAFDTHGVANHNNIDSLVTKLACEAALKTGSSLIGELAFKKNGNFIVPENQLRDSLEYLNEYGTIHWEQDLSGSLRGVSITESGFEIYAREHIPNYTEITQSVISLIINSNARNSEAIRDEANAPIYLTDHVIRTLESGGKIRVSWYLDNNYVINNVSASLRRSLN